MAGKVIDMGTKHNIPVSIHGPLRGTGRPRGISKISNILGRDFGRRRIISAIGLQDIDEIDCLRDLTFLGGS